MRIDAAVALIGDLDVVELTGWVDRGWVQPEAAGEAWEFHEIDIARIRLIRDLRHDMEVGEDAIPLVLSLLDQVYELRGQLRRVLEALGDQSPAVRAAIASAMRQGRAP